MILSYNHYTLQNTMLADLVPYLKAKGVGIMNAAPFSARLLTNAAAAAVAQGDAGSARRSARRRPTTVPRTASTSPSWPCSTAIANEDMTTCIVGSANPENVKKWVAWADTPIDPKLLGEVLDILKPIHNWFYLEGRPENNDPQSVV